MISLDLSLAEFSEKLVEIFYDACGRSRPLLVYHYTDIDAFIGIIRNKELWLSDLRFMNDATELNYGYSLLREFVKTRKVKLLDGEFDRVPKDNRIYGTCFCEDRNLLSQWRGYHADVSIGFETAWIHQLGISMFNRVLYEKDEQQRLFQELVAHFETFYSKYVAEYEDAVLHQEIEYDNTIADGSPIGQIIDRFRLWCEVFSAYTKTGYFKEEKEWRIIAGLATQRNAKTKQPISFRRRDGYLLPYIKLELKPALIREIVIGPSERKGLLHKGVSMFLQEHGLEHINVDNPDAPLRF